MRRVVLAAVPVALVLAAPAAGARLSNAPWVVVGRQHGVLLASSNSGVVEAVHGRAAIGARVRLRGDRVAGVVGRARTALIRGVVVRRTGGLTFLSAVGHLLVVHTGRRPASATDTPPAPGTVVAQTVSIDDQGDLDDQGEQALGQSPQVQIQAQISAVGTGTVTLTVNGQQLTLPLPGGLTLPSALIGTQVTLNVTFAGGAATASDQGDSNDQGDDDQADQQDAGSSDTQSGEQDGSGDQQASPPGSAGGSDAGSDG